jgi:hypothetical protein
MTKEPKEKILETKEFTYKEKSMVATALTYEKPYALTQEHSVGCKVSLAVDGVECWKEYFKESFSKKVLQGAVKNVEENIEWYIEQINQDNGKNIISKAE